VSSLTFTVFDRQVSSMVYQDESSIKETTETGEMKRSQPLICLAIKVCPFACQEAHTFRMLPWRRTGEESTQLDSCNSHLLHCSPRSAQFLYGHGWWLHSESDCSLAINVCSVIYQEAHSFRMAFSGGEMKRSSSKYIIVLQSTSVSLSTKKRTISVVWP
jgi:hypothetical protein